MFQALLGIHLAVLLFGISGLFGKLISVSPVVIVFGRTLVAACTLAVYKIKEGGFSYFSIKRKTLVHFILLGVLLAFHWLSFFYSIQISTVAVGLLSFSTFPIFVLILEPFFFKEKISPFELVCGVIVFLGLCFVVPTFDIKNNLFQGTAVGIISSLSFAAIAVLNRLFVGSFSAIKVAFFQNTFAAVILLPLVLSLKPTISYKDGLLILFLGIFCTAVAHTLFVNSLRKIPARTASIIASLEPVYAIVFAYFLLGESPSVRPLR
ncbi:DMT family transporter [Scytonema sp. NUACC26]|uniref:DMT family transporter n=1 Tax=Scytonema sp. NUACC26 TaxID=3140176 RepID=UPI0034DC9702